MDCHRNLFPCAYMDPQRAGHFWCRLQVVPLDLATGKWAPLVRATGSWEPLVWPEGSGGLNTMQHLLCDLRWWGQTTAVISDTRGRHGPPPLRVSA